MESSGVPHSMCMQDSHSLGHATSLPTAMMLSTSPQLTINYVKESPRREAKYQVPSSGSRVQEFPSHPQGLITRKYFKRKKDSTLPLHTSNHENLPSTQQFVLRAFYLQDLDSPSTPALCIHKRFSPTSTLPLKCSAHLKLPFTPRSRNSCQLLLYYKIHTLQLSQIEQVI